MKVLGYCMLHYGADYLEDSLKALSEVCEKIVILYSLNPTHQPRGGETNRETRSDLIQISNKFSNTFWVDCFNVTGEAHHRGKIWDYVKGYDVLVNADADEVWDVQDLKNAVQEVYNSPYRAHGIDGFVTLWRSFDWQTNADSYRPVRLWNLREKNTEKQPEIKAKIYHFGYAIRRRTMTYKWSIHGHKDELRPEWNNIWHNWQPKAGKGEFHPTSYGVWTEIKPFDKNQLPKFMREHKFFNLPII